MAKEVILKMDFSTEQTVGEITKILGLVKAKFYISVIDSLNLEANPRASKTGSVTDDIQESLEFAPKLFPFKTKGILLASSRFTKLERNRIAINPSNTDVEGILDGGHNTLAIGLYILRKAMENQGEKLRGGAKTWDDFKNIWELERNTINQYLEDIRDGRAENDIDFYIPIELLVPRDPEDENCVESFKRDLLEICAARNNNVQLQVAAKANQQGYFDSLKSLMEERNPHIAGRIEWKTNDGGSIKTDKFISLVWIPLQLVSEIKDQSGRVIEPVAPQKMYSAKGSCLKQFEKLMSSDQVTSTTTQDYRRELTNYEVMSAFKVAVQMPELFDYIYTNFPDLYNAAGGRYGNINAVIEQNKGHQKCAPFSGEKITVLSPDGYIYPLVYGLLALIEKKEVRGHTVIDWKTDPMQFLRKNLESIVKRYVGIFSMCDYDPQKIGKNSQSYMQALDAFTMAQAGLLK